MDKNVILRSFDSSHFSPLPFISLPNKKRPRLNPLSLASPINSKSHLKKLSSFTSALTETRSQASLLPSPSASEDIFPQWLLDRNDFKSSLISSCEESDIGKICAKPSKQRDFIENRELYNWCRSCSFFKPYSDFTCSEVCARLATQEYMPGDTLMKEGDVGDKMCIILKGKVGIYKKGIMGCLDTIGPTNIVGETALESNCLRTATVIALDYLTVLQLTREDYTNIIARQKHKQRSVIVNLLKNIPFFCNLLSARLEVIAWSMLLMHYDAEQTIYLEGQVPNGIYFIKEGSVKLMTTVTVTNKHKIPTTHTKKETFVQKKTFELLVKKVSTGDFFGEEELLSNKSRKTRAVCIGNSELLIFKKELIFDMFSENERNMIGQVHEKMKTSEQLRKELKHKIAKENMKKNAIISATSLPRGSPGTLSLERLLRRKKDVAKSVNVKVNCDLNESLLKEECFFE